MREERSSGLDDLSEEGSDLGGALEDESLERLKRDLLELIVVLLKSGDDEGNEILGLLAHLDRGGPVSAERGQLGDAKTLRAGLIT